MNETTRILIVLAIFALWNLVVFAMYGVDKSKAKRGKWRIPEKTLLLSAFLGGGIGAFLGMRILRHKTKHLQFQILVPIFMLISVALVTGIIYFI